VAVNSVYTTAVFYIYSIAYNLICVVAVQFSTLNTLFCMLCVYFFSAKFNDVSLYVCNVE